MEFEQVLDQAIELLRRRGRVTYRALQRQFGLDEAYVHDLRDELVLGQRVARDEDGVVLVWIGDAESAPPTEEASSEDAISEAPASQSAAAAQVPEAERRQLTVMFCDLVASTRLSMVLDPEDLRDVLRSYQEASREVIDRYGGHIAQYLGDGLLIYFGYPVAMEYAAQRAIHAGLEIVDRLHELNASLKEEHGIELKVRVGIHTGIVVVGAIAARGSQPLALGGTPNLAARLQSVAAPDTVVLSAATHELAGAAFECLDLGEQELKGADGAMRIYRALRPVDVDRVSPAGPAQATLFVGREAEFDTLIARWAHVREGHGQAVFVSGEAGIGKSRLLDAAQARVEQSGAQRIEFRCSPYYENTALHPIAGALRRMLQLEPDATLAVQKARVQRYLQELDIDDEAGALLITSLLSGRGLDAGPLAEMMPQVRRRKTVDLLVQWLLRVADRRPLLVVCEDLHWADPTTLEYLNRLIEQLATVPILALMTYRPDFSPPWPMRSHMSSIVLGRFTNTQIEGMVLRLTNGKPLPHEVIRRIQERTDGVPLFIEEITRYVLESGLLTESGERYELRAPLGELAIPATLQDSLMARLDRLAGSREIAQLGAAIGREFTYELICAVADSPEADVVHALDRLVMSELVLQRGIVPNATYVFRHALIQDVAYHSLLRKVRQGIHDRIADVLGTQFPQLVEARPELMAHHLSGAHRAREAAPLWRLAGARALERSAHREAQAHLARAIEQVTGAGADPEFKREEARLRVMLGVPLTALQGYGARDVRRTYARARDLAREAGDEEPLFKALYGLFRYHLLRAEYAEAEALGRELLEIAQGEDRPEARAEAHRAIGSALFYQGRLAAAREHLEAVFDIESPGESRTKTYLYDVVDAYVTSRAYLAWTLWFQGYAEQARLSSEQAVAMARGVRHPFSRALALSFGAWQRHFANDVAGTEKFAAEALAISEEQEFAFWIGWNEVLLGWVESHQGDLVSGVRRAEAGLAHWQEHGSMLGRSYFLSILSEMHRRAKNTEVADRLLAEAQAFAESSDERWWLPELLRLRAEHGLDWSGVGAVKLYERALDLAREQGSRFHEIRCSLSLARLSLIVGRVDEARAMLVESVERCEDGTDPAPLVEVRALLERIDSGQLEED